MRVIAGRAGSIPLLAPEGNKTRPTTDRIKETLFNIISPYIYDSVFLDIFSGSGAIAIEALSRGARKAYLIENDRRALDCIRKNLEKTRLAKEATVIGKDVFNALTELSGEKGLRMDVIFMDPPYSLGLEKQVLSKIRASGLADEDTLFIVEADLKSDAYSLIPEGYVIESIKKYKTNRHIFLRLVQEEHADSDISGEL